MRFRPAAALSVLLFVHIVVVSSFFCFRCRDRASFVFGAAAVVENDIKELHEYREKLERIVYEPSSIHVRLRRALCQTIPLTRMRLVFHAARCCPSFLLLVVVVVAVFVARMKRNETKRNVGRAGAIVSSAARERRVVWLVQPRSRAHFDGVPVSAPRRRVAVGVVHRSCHMLRRCVASRSRC